MTGRDYYYCYWCCCYCCCCCCECYRSYDEVLNLDSCRNCITRMTLMSLKPRVQVAIGSLEAASIDSSPIDSVQALKKGIVFGLETRKSP